MVSSVSGDGLGRVIFERCNPPADREKCWVCFESHEDDDTPQSWVGHRSTVQDLAGRVHQKCLARELLFKLTNPNQVNCGHCRGSVGFSTDDFSLMREILLIKVPELHTLSEADQNNSAQLETLLIACHQNNRDAVLKIFNNKKWSSEPATDEQKRLLCLFIISLLKRFPKGPVNEATATFYDHLPLEYQEPLLVHRLVQGDVGFLERSAPVTREGFSQKTYDQVRERLIASLLIPSVQFLDNASLAKYTTAVTKCLQNAFFKEKQRLNPSCFELSIVLQNIQLFDSLLASWNCSFSDEQFLELFVLTQSVHWSALERVQKATREWFNYIEQHMIPQLTKMHTINPLYSVEGISLPIIDGESLETLLAKIPLDAKLHIRETVTSPVIAIPACRTIEARAHTIRTQIRAHFKEIAYYNSLTSVWRKKLDQIQSQRDPLIDQQIADRLLLMIDALPEERRAKLKGLIEQNQNDNESLRRARER